MNKRQFPNFGFVLIGIFSICAYPALAGGAGAVFGDFGDTGLTPFTQPEKVMQATQDMAHPESPVSLAENTTGTITAQAVNASPVDQGVNPLNQTGNISESTISTNTTSLNETEEPSLGDLIRAGDLNAVTAFQVQRKNNLTGASEAGDTAEKNSQTEPDNSLEGGYVFTVQYPCPS